MIKPGRMGQGTGASKQKSMTKLTDVRKLQDTVVQLMRPPKESGRAHLPKALEFGYEFTCSYSVHGIPGQVKNIFYNKNI